MHSFFIFIPIRVNGDKNLLDLVEAELGSRLVRSYLVDNSRDARLLSRLKDSWTCTLSVFLLHRLIS